MQISLNWVNELVNLETIELNTLIEKLILGGFEVEEVLKIPLKNKLHILLDISSTTNRSDSLSIHGISKEIAALLNLNIPKKFSKTRQQNQKWKQQIENKLKLIPKNTNCSIFITVIVKNLTNLSAPKWIKQKLLSSNLTLKNNLIDFQNYILLETGYPFEFYDFETICTKLKTSNFNLEIINNPINSTFLTNDNFNYKLSPLTSLIVANKVPISIMGLIVSNEFTTSEDTTQILIEGSIFKSTKIRQQSRKLGLKTDRSARYEKSLKNNYLVEALYRLLSLLRISNPDLVCKFHTIKKELEPSLDIILLRYETIIEILGPICSSQKTNLNYIDPEIITDYLKRLNFNVTFNKANLTWEVERPISRIDDITREIDLIEEIGRLHGFNNFQIRLPKIEKIGIEDSNYKIRKKITTCFLNLGFNEVIHYSIVNSKTFLKNEVQILNPLLVDYSNLRASLLPNLIKTFQSNLRQKNITIEGFEYGHIFNLDSTLKFCEKEKIAGIFGGFRTKTSWITPENEFTWFEAKGKIEQFFHHLNIVTNWKQSLDLKTNNLFHQYRSAEIYLINQIKLGVFGQINPSLANQLKIPEKIYLFEFDIEVVKQQIQKNKLTFLKPYSFYPKVIKDLSFIIKKTVPFQKIKNLLHLNGTDFLSQINLLDEYKNESIDITSSSLCLQLIFQSKKKTLEARIIEKIVLNLKKLLIQEFSAIIRI